MESGGTAGGGGEGGIRWGWTSARASAHAWRRSVQAGTLFYCWNCLVL